jgi:hypothetical protein
MALEEYGPLTEAELDAMEQRAKGPKDWPGDEILRLIAEIRRLRKAFQAPPAQSDAEECRPIWEEIVELMQDVSDSWYEKFQPG